MRTDDDEPFDPKLGQRQMAVTCHMCGAWYQMPCMERGLVMDSQVHMVRYREWLLSESGGFQAIGDGLEYLKEEMRKFL